MVSVVSVCRPYPALTEREMSGANGCEVSCGAVVFTMTEDGLRYLLVQEKEGFWVFPKGHMEEGETEKDTADREIREETGLSVRFIEGFRAVDEHNLAREGHPERVKRTVYFLAAYENQAFRPQEKEISRIALMDYAEAMAAFRFDSFKEILAKANTFLQQNIA